MKRIIRFSIKMLRIVPYSGTTVKLIIDTPSGVLQPFRCSQARQDCSASAVAALKYKVHAVLGKGNNDKILFFFYSVAPLFFGLFRFKQSSVARARLRATKYSLVC